MTSHMHLDHFFILFQFLEKHLIKSSLHFKTRLSVLTATELKWAFYTLNVQPFGIYYWQMLSSIL